MAVPPEFGTRIPPAFDDEPRNDPSPKVPGPLPDRSRRAATTAIVIILTALVVIALIALL